MATFRYEDALRAAEKQFDADSGECIRLAKRNLTDRPLPPYYKIQNCILIASACDLWEDADVWRNAARQAYLTSRAKASRANDTSTLEMIEEACKQLDELDELLAEEMDEFLEEERMDLPHTPESEKANVFWGSEASEAGGDVGSDEGDGENDTLKLGDEQGQTSGTLDLPLRARTVPPPEPKAASSPKTTTAPKSIATTKTMTTLTRSFSFLRDTASFAAKKREAPSGHRAAENTRARMRRGRGAGNE